ncbi:hypothetical protein GCM10010275_66620 [Streptomyces litmocidini]|nr:hypothetical protein GCM10010275_66620 [Streptomyces litmocidini]
MIGVEGGLGEGGMIQSVGITADRHILAHQLFTGISQQHPACLVEELAVPWQAVVEGRRHAARGGARKRGAGTGTRHRLVFVDRLVVTPIHLRHDLPHSVLALLSGVDRSTVTRAIGEIRGILAERGCAVPERPGLRLRILTDVFAYARAEGVELRLDATEVQVRRPVAGRGGRRAFVSGKKKQNTMKATVIADSPLCGILFVLHTGIQWEYLPQELGFGSGMTCRRRLAAWNEAGVRDRLHTVLLTKLRSAKQLDRSRAVIDSSHVRAARRGPKVDPARSTEHVRAASTTSSSTDRASRSPCL